MATVKTTTKGSVKSKSSTSSPTREVNSKKSSHATMAAQSSDSRGPDKNKSCVPSSSNPRTTSASSVYASKDHNLVSKTRSQGTKSKQSMAKGTQSTTGIKQTLSPKCKQLVKSASHDESKGTKKSSEKHRQDVDSDGHKTGHIVKVDKVQGVNKSEEANEKSTNEDSKGGGSENNRLLLDVVRERCLAKGRHGIHGLGILFRHLDVDYNKRIVFDELKDKLKDFGVELSDSNLQALFRMLDVDKSGGIDFLELMTSLRPPMKEARRKVIDEAFDQVDMNGNGVVDQNEIKGRCIVKAGRT